MNKLLILGVVLAVILASAVAATVGMGLLTTKTSTGVVTTATTPTSTATTSSQPPQREVKPVSQVSSGLVAADSFNASQSQAQLQANQTYWTYGGSAATQSSTSYSYYTEGTQLRIGVVALQEGSWSGLYAVSPPTNATLAHSIVAAPSEILPGHFGGGLYVQSSNALLNYVGCIVVTTPTGVMWEIVHGNGTSRTASSIEKLWSDINANQKSTRDCTIITNGANYLKVYLDHSVVYQSRTLKLGMPAPFNFFLESQTSYAGKMTYAGFRDFYATMGENVTVTSAPADATTAVIVDTSGKVLATAPVMLGTANLVMGQYSFPQTAYIKLYSSASTFSSSTLIASTSTAVPIYGGDVFTFGTYVPPSKSTPAAAPTLTLTAQDAHGNSLSGIHVALMVKHTTIASNFMPVTFTLNASQIYTIRVDDFGQYTFDHWSDGSNVRIRTMSFSTNTELTAYYRNINDPAPAGKAILLVTAVDTNNKPLTGFDMTLWQNGKLVQNSFLPGNFLINTGTEYEVVVTSFGNYKFDHWSDGGTDPTHIVNTSGVTVKLVAVYRLVSG